MDGQSVLDFDRPARRVETPIARANDPLSSHVAAAEFTSSGKRQSHLETIVAAVYAHPGCTAGELTRYTGLTHVQIDRRTGDLRIDARVCFGAVRTCSVVGSLMQTLFPVTVLEKAA